MDKIIDEVRTELKNKVDVKIRDSAHKFFKESVKSYGVSTAKVGKIAEEFFVKIKNREKEEIFKLCEELLKSDYNEEAWIAFGWSYAIRKQYQPEDFKIFEKWIGSYVNNWAKCDTLCNHSVGSFIEMYPDFVSFLFTWAKLENRWFRRASAVTLVLPARKGLFLEEVFRIADNLLHDPDDLVQKGYGWMLKEASKSHLDEVYHFILNHKQSMPRTALRYAIEKMPKEYKVKAMEK